MKHEPVLPAKTLLLALLLCCVCPLGAAPSAGEPVGIFEGQGDIGNVLHPGSVEFDSSHHSYTIAGSGENMWFGKDEFYFVWTKLSGDASLAADISFVGAGGNPHRKAVLMIRQSLATDSVYADVALHGVGLTSLQYRDVAGTDTREVQASISAPKRLRIEKRGDQVSMLVSAEPGDPAAVAGSIQIAIHGPFYVGLGVCSHDRDVVEKAVFSNVQLLTPPASAPN